jgi:hypothetical protein
MRQLLRRLEEAKLEDASRSEWVAQNLVVFAASFAQRASETYKGPGSVYPRKWYGKLEQVLADNGVGPLNAKQLGLFSEAYERLMQVYASKNPQDFKAIGAITRDITDRAKALARS